MLALRRPLAPALLLALPLAGQAPPLAELWRVAGSTLSVPAALATGPAATFWNPAALADDAPSRALSVEILETPDVLALSGFLAAGQWRISRRIAVGALLGRMAVSDLVRTTTSPVAIPGDIPVHSQVVGLAVGLDAGPLAVGVLARGHEARLDEQRESGATVDAGMRLRPVPALTLAASTRFLAPDLARNGSAELNVGMQGRLPMGSIWGTGAHAMLSVGAGWHGEERAAVGIGAAVGLNDRLEVSWAFAHERAFEIATWRHTLGIGFTAGQYRIAVARSEGLNGLGATYRLGLTAASTS